MTNKEIKLELAKAALASCSHMTSETLTESLKRLYEWVVAEPVVYIDNFETDYKKVSVREIIKYLSEKDSDKRYATSLANVFNNNKIGTIADLLKYRRCGIMKIENIGYGSITRLDDALEELYGIRSW